MCLNKIFISWITTDCTCFTLKLFFLQTSFHSLIDEPDVAAEYWDKEALKLFRLDYNY